jgi:hypothetical protein
MYTISHNEDEECEEGVKGEESDDDEEEEVMEKLIRSHSKRKRSLHSSQVAPRKVGKAKDKQKVKEKANKKAIGKRKMVGESCKGCKKKRMNEQ